MRKLFTLLLLLPFIGMAQAPQAFDFQGVARDAAGNALVSQSVSLRLSLLDGDALGPVLYQELHGTTTNAFGLFNVRVGEGAPVTGVFAEIDWGADTRFLKVELDAAGGSSYLDMGTTQLLSVPYALFANSIPCSRVSLLGDTLFQTNGCYVVIPGISVANGGCKDLDGDGVYDHPGCSDPIDCDDLTATTYPGASEICGNGVDDDCDGIIDNHPTATITWYLDGDGDGFGDPNVTLSACAQPPGHVLNDDDCDDGDAALFPGQGCSLICSSADVAAIANDQAGYLQTALGALSLAFPSCGVLTGPCVDAFVLQVLELEYSGSVGNACHACAVEYVNCFLSSCFTACVGGGAACYACQQSNGCFSAFTTCAGLIDADGDGWAPPSDCDDADPNVYPNRAEVCDGIDNDCDGQIDEGVLPTWYPDLDGDGYGDQTAPGIVACDAPVGQWASNDQDCDDSDAAVFYGNGCSDVCSAADASAVNAAQASFLNAVYSAVQGNQLMCMSQGTTTYQQCMIDNLDFPYASLPVTAACQECAEQYITCYYTFCHPNDCQGGLTPTCTSCLHANGCLSAFITCMGLVDSDGDGWVTGSDCDDGDPSSHPFAGEVCDGIDNDCDGMIDEGFNLQTDVSNCGACGIVCPMGSSCVSGVCTVLDQDGDGFPAGMDCDDQDASAFPGATEFCDGVDNDCDGMIDEDFNLNTDASNCGFCGNACPPGSACVNGVCMAPDLDGDGFGNDVDCDDQNAATYPNAPELCDGVDNDCDGMIDEDFNLNANASNCGFCGNACPPGSACVNGVCMAPDLDGDGFGNDVDCDDQNAATYPNAPELCDGVDNDCDGMIDEDFNLNANASNCGFCGNACPPGSACVNGVCMAPDLDGDGFGNDVDCDDQNPNIYPNAPELCDGMDNDCDGVIDEGDPGGGGACNTGLPGQCGQGTLVCQNGMLICVPNSAPSLEMCDGIDNDCDGLIDEGNPGGGGACNTGLPGQCGTGTLLCQSGALICVPNGPPTAEVCDGIDNDCDGIVDEGNPGGGGPCNTGLPGQCSQGTLVCQSGMLVCVPNSSPGVEVCDGIDNDCDGIVDEGNPGGGGPCNTGLVGQCASGTLICQFGALTCVPNNPPSTEVCDGVDNDCDGMVDEGFNVMTDPSNCGFCGNVCSLPNAVSACTSGVCTIGFCLPGYADCNGLAFDGCETFVGGGGCP
ncbi:MAG: hypothetical protein JNM31_12975 [Flavobacteriales bacterium]|nr:hypothetical protein [Flavobacteriales bacterium]